jgi:hypothetical protein
VALDPRFCALHAVFQKIGILMRLAEGAQFLASRNQPGFKIGPRKHDTQRKERPRASLSGPLRQ